MFLPLLVTQRFVWRETNHWSPVDQIRSIFNAKWNQGLQLQTACCYMSVSAVRHLYM